MYSSHLSKLVGRQTLSTNSLRVSLMTRENFLPSLR